MQQSIKYFLLLIVLISKLSLAQLIVSVRSPESANDSRENYNIALISLALEKTKAKYGNYELRPVPIMTRQRAQYSASANLFPNLVIEESYEDSFVKEGHLTYANFPIELGIIGMRVCFVNPKLKDKLNQVTSIEQLKKYNVGQGAGWTDVKILRAQGFKVTEISNYDSIFKMTAAGRIDLFCRGANEVLSESKSFESIKQLTLNESFAIFYPLPRFYFMHASNQQLKNRIEEGLKIAYADGSLKTLWLKKFGESVEFSKLKQRKIFRIDNPFIPNLPTDYMQYFYNPEI